MKLCIILYLVLISAAQAMILNITGQESTKGSVALAIFSSEEGFPKDSEKAVYRKFIDFNKFPLTINLKKGEYAASIFHDENNNQKLDTNFIGIPKESFGFSNDVMGLMGPPSFKKAKFKVLDNKTSISIKLKTFL